MDLIGLDGPRLDPEHGDLLARAARPVERAALADELRGLGWCRHDLDAWTAGARAAVLYDPVDARIRAAGLARQIAPGTFELLIGSVADGVGDRRTLGERLIRALGDRLRRLGGERLLAEVEACGLPIEALETAGFRPSPGPLPGAAGRIGCLEL